MTAATWTVIGGLVALGGLALYLAFRFPEDVADYGNEDDHEWFFEELLDEKRRGWDE